MQLQMAMTRGADLHLAEANPTPELHHAMAILAMARLAILVQTITTAAMDTGVQMEAMEKLMGGVIRGGGGIKEGATDMLPREMESRMIKECTTEMHFKITKGAALQLLLLQWPLGSNR